MRRQTLNVPRAAVESHAQTPSSDGSRETISVYVNGRHIFVSEPLRNGVWQPSYTGVGLHFTAVQSWTNLIKLCHFQSNKEDRSKARLMKLERGRIASLARLPWDCGSREPVWGFQRPSGFSNAPAVMWLPQTRGQICVRANETLGELTSLIHMGKWKWLFREQEDVFEHKPGANAHTENVRLSS